LKKNIPINLLRLFIIQYIINPLFKEEVMRYIITESRLENLIFKFLNEKLEGIELKKGDYSDIVFVFPGEEFGLMGWKKSNQLFSYYEIVDEVKNVFSMDESDSLDVIGRYVESRYNLKVDGNKYLRIFNLRPLKVDGI
jgi:hypothetical protein